MHTSKSGQLDPVEARCSCKWIEVTMVQEFQPVVAEDRPPSSDGTQCIVELQSHPQEVVELQQFTSVNLGLDSPNPSPMTSCLRPR
jgi:hypothetical protein